MKTICFKAYLDASQQSKCENWLNALKWVWNEGLRLLEEFDELRAYDKKSKLYVPCSPIRWQYHWEKGAKGEWVPVRPYCPLNRKMSYHSDPPPEFGAVPRLSRDSYFSLSAYFTGANHKDKPWFCDVPSSFVRGTLKSLFKAWGEYKKGKRKHPRYKRHFDKITTLINEDSKATKITKNSVTVPRLGAVKTDNSIKERWLLQEPVCTLKLTKKASGWYLQLTGEIPYTLPNANDKAVGIDVGAKVVIATSDGELVEPPKYGSKSKKRLARLQRSLSRRKGGKNVQRGQSPSNRYLRRQKQLARQHEKVADQRRLFNHSLSTDLVSRYGIIAVEDIKLTNLTKRAKPKKNEKGNGYERNGASAKSGLTKSLLDNGLGQLLTFIETKSEVTGGKFIRVSPHYTSQECSNCGTIVKKSLSTRTHNCPECGYIEDRDVNAAINILNKGANLLNLPGLHRESNGQGDFNGVNELSNPIEVNQIVGSLDPLRGNDCNGKSEPIQKKKQPKRNKPRKESPQPFVQLALDLPGFQVE